jgi:hypothetical protein
MAIHNAWRDKFARRVDYLGTGSRAEIFPDLRDLAVPNKNVRILKRAVNSRKHRRVLYQKLFVCLAEGRKLQITQDQ